MKFLPPSIVNNNVEQIDYSQYYIAFLDVLGFKRLVSSKNKKDKVKIAKYFELIKRITNCFQSIELKKEIGSIVISDSVVLSIPFGEDEDSRINNLRQLCVAIGIIQYNLSMENVWIRGAISCGSAFFNPKEYAIVGPAYIQSYLLQEKVAKYPRVIVDNKIIKALGKSTAKELIDSVNILILYHGFTNWRGNILFDWTDSKSFSERLNQDIALFIDYLSPLLRNENKRDAFKIINNIKDNIYTSSEIYDKYRWVADYLIHMYGKMRIDEAGDVDEYYDEMFKLVEEL